MRSEVINQDRRRLLSTAAMGIAAMAAASLFPVSTARAATSDAIRLYLPANVSIPAAVTVFPGESFQAPRSWAERAYHKLIYFHQADKGGHFAAWEQPDLFSAELRAAFRSLRQSS
jgi:pimeloyl-ACP methyl ester carboxylesterase